MKAARSSKFYPMLNKPGGGSVDAWAAVKKEYPLLDGLDDSVLNAAFLATKTDGVGRKPASESGGGAVGLPWQTLQTSAASPFQSLKAPEKVALVRAVRYGLYDKTLEANGGDAAQAWASILKEYPDLAGRSVDELEAATKELLDGPAAASPAAPAPAGGSGGSSFLGDLAQGAAPLAAVAIVAALGYSGFEPADVLCSASTSVACIERKARDTAAPSSGGPSMNEMVQRNVNKWVDKNLPPMGPSD